MNKTGQCLCGAVTFSADGVPENVHACHCSMCRRWGGGPLLAARVESVTFGGDENISYFDSSDWAQRAFCGRCGANLYFRLKGDDQYFISVGAFDDVSSFNLGGEIYVDTKPAFYEFSGDHPRLTEEEFLATFQKNES